MDISGANARPGDVVLVSGTLGDHGIAVLSAREGLGFETDLVSDVAPLNHLVEAMLGAGEIHVLRDPTRGGLATTLNEIAEQSGVVIELNEQTIPVKPQVRAACEMLGFDPLYVASEGKLVAIVKAEDAEKILAAMKSHQYGDGCCDYWKCRCHGGAKSAPENGHWGNETGGHASRRNAAEDLLKDSCGVDVITSTPF